MPDAEFALSLGVNALGFIFYRQSPRYISPFKASKIVADLERGISFVGVFADESVNFIDEVSEKVGLNFVQLHGSESPEYCSKVKLPVIKAIRIKTTFDVGSLKNYKVHAFLFDTYKNDQLGGTGDVFNWQIISDLNLDTPIILSGGLCVENVQEAINVVAPSAVDVNSGIESCPGKKNTGKMKLLVKTLSNLKHNTNPFALTIR